MTRAEHGPSPVAQAAIDDLRSRLRAEGRNRDLPWVLVGEGGAALRIIAQAPADAGAGAGTVPVVLLHGWPDSFLRFEKVLPLLSDLHLIAPAFPGFPFAAPDDCGGMSAAAMAEAPAVALGNSPAGLAA